MFDFDRFDSAQFTFPTKKIPVPEIKDFFEEGQEAVWECRSLNGHELAIVNEAVETYSRKKAIMKALASGNGTNSEITKGVQIFLNNDESITPEDLIRRHKMLELASIPPCPENICVKLAYVKPTVFLRITNEIIKATGDGAELGK